MSARAFTRGERMCLRRIARIWSRIDGREELPVVPNVEDDIHGEHDADYLRLYREGLIDPIPHWRFTVAGRDAYRAANVGARP